MAKKGLGKLVALTAIAGAAVAGISYFKKYQSFSKELDEDFHDFEDEEDAPVPDSTMNRNYVSLHADKDELLVAASDMLNAARDVAGAAKNVVKDAAAIMADSTREAVTAVSDTAAAKVSFSEEGTELDEEPDFDDTAEAAGELVPDSAALHIEISSEDMDAADADPSEKIDIE